MREQDLTPGTELPPLVVTPTSRELVMYGAATGDYYEAHYDAEFAHARGLPGVIVHGLLKLAYLARAVTDWAGPDAFVRQVEGSYRGIDLVNQPFRVEAVVEEARREREGHLVTVALRGTSAAGAVTTPGRATVEIPTG